MWFGIHSSKRRCAPAPPISSNALNQHITPIPSAAASPPLYSLPHAQDHPTCPVPCSKRSCVASSVPALIHVTTLEVSEKVPSTTVHLLPPSWPRIKLLPPDGNGRLTPPLELQRRHCKVAPAARGVASLEPDSGDWEWPWTSGPLCHSNSNHKAATRKHILPNGP